MGCKWEQHVMTCGRLPILEYGCVKVNNFVVLWFLHFSPPPQSLICFSFLPFFLLPVIFFPSLHSLSFLSPSSWTLCAHVCILLQVSFNQIILICHIFIVLYVLHFSVKYISKFQAKKVVSLLGFVVCLITVVNSVYVAWLMTVNIDCIGWGLGVP